MLYYNVANIFPEEPPPLVPSDDDDDIFSDVHNPEPYKRSGGPSSDHRTDLFDDHHDDIFDDFSDQHVSKTACLITCPGHYE